MRRSRFCHLIVFLLCLAGTANALSVKDDRGKTLNLPAPAQRIAAVSYFGADTALALGLTPVATTHMVQGRSPAFLLGRLNQATDLGQRAAPNLERLSQAKPDLIVAMRRYTEANAARLEKVAPYLALRLETFADSERSIRLFGDAVGRRTEAEALNARFRTTLADFAAKAPQERKPRYLFLWGGGEAPWAFYNENITSTLLNRLGGINVAGGNPTPQVPDNTAFEMNMEAILIANPDVIFIYDYGAARPFEQNPLWKTLKAVKNGRVIYVQDHWIEAFGPLGRQATLFEAVHYLYPDRFAKPDLPKVLGGLLPK
ncbi:ABC transporter substrate-binding protein [Andreprevotia chitinilytica]|uniref:ABC transporter substrate-binding protein n=1 Tax=Andreprevotia chitinilytica TaxID=396808 RepID=UPI00055565D5|nr:ABC transporter substrate-binding protein [Andreprevotia chitinilytica]